MPFKGTRKRLHLLTIGKKSVINFNPKANSTPFKKSVRRPRPFSTPGQPFKSPANKKRKYSDRKCFSPIVRDNRALDLAYQSEDSQFETDEEDTWLYSDGEETQQKSTKDRKSSKKALQFDDTSYNQQLQNDLPKDRILSFNGYQNRNGDFLDCPEVCEPIYAKDDEAKAKGKTVHKLLDDVIAELNSNGIGQEFIAFLKLVADGKFPLDNVAFLLFLDVVKWYDTIDVRTVRYNDTSLKFFCLGQRLFGGRFLRFMSGPKNETDFVLGKRILSPTASKINFACPSDKVLSEYNPLGYELSVDNRPGLINKMIKLTSAHKSDCNSYVLMFDGKK